MSIGFNLPAAVALARLSRRRGIPVIAHHHDFYWEGFRGMRPTCDVVKRLAQEFLPPKDSLVSHVVINSLAKAELLTTSGLRSTIIPNVFDFCDEPWHVDSYNYNFRESIGVGKDDVLVLQATRIVERKAIELAIALVKELNKPSNIVYLREAGLYDGRAFGKQSHIVLVLAGSLKDRKSEYLDRLKILIRQTGIQARFIGDQVSFQRQEEGGKHIYSLWDCYVFADLVTYPSLFEGWGNQFLEAIRARLPVALFEYPVFRADIKGRGFDVISLGGNARYLAGSNLAYVEQSIISKAARKAVETLTNSSMRKEIVDHNFALGKKHYSLESLGEYSDQILSQIQRKKT